MITQAEYVAIVRAAQLMCKQEISAAASQYRDEVRPFAAKRKERGKTARRERDERIADARKQLYEVAGGD